MTPAITTWGERNHAVRTERWRYIRYRNGDEELYDHTNDPDEFTNLAGNENYDSLKKKLSAHLPKVNAASLKVPQAK